MHAGNGPPLSLPAALHRTRQPHAVRLVHPPLSPLHVAVCVRRLPLCLRSLRQPVVVGGRVPDAGQGLVGVDLAAAELCVHPVGVGADYVPVPGHR